MNKPWLTEQDKTLRKILTITLERKAKRDPAGAIARLCTAGLSEAYAKEIVRVLQ